MTRVGVNPARGKTTSYRPARVTVAILTYIPSFEGYFENRLEVLKLVFTSLKAHTAIPYDLYVFDNCSCEPVIASLRSLQQRGYLDALLLSSRNIGKIDALRILFNTAPGEIIAYSDDDIFFYPGWLEAHLEILDNFPKVGMVSGLAVRNAAGHAMHSLEELASAPPSGMTITRERLIPDEWEIDWASSTGRDPQSHLLATKDQNDLVFRMQKPGSQNSIEAVGAANHFQFVSPKKVILQALPKAWTGKLMGSMIELDESIDRLGYLRLSTARRTIRHLGNSLSEEIQHEAASLGVMEVSKSSPEQHGGRQDTRRKHWLLRIPGSRLLLHSVYRRLFDILFNP